MREAKPSCGFRYPSDPNLARDETQDGISICRLLDNAWGAQATASAHIHQLIVDSGIDPAMKPDERLIPKISQSNAFSLHQRMTFGHGEDHSVQRELPVFQHSGGRGRQFDAGHSLAHSLARVS